MAQVMVAFVTAVLSPGKLHTGSRQAGMRPPMQLWAHRFVTRLQLVCDIGLHQQLAQLGSAVELAALQLQAGPLLQPGRGRGTKAGLAAGTWTANVCCQGAVLRTAAQPANSSCGAVNCSKVPVT